MTDTPRVHHWPVRVYYEDTDFSGVVYHANYLRFLERGRSEFLRAVGVDQAALFAGGHAFAVRSMTLEFQAAARMDEMLDIESLIEAVGGASVTMMQWVRRDGAPLVEARVRLGLVREGRASRLPAWLVAKLRATTPQG